MAKPIIEGARKLKRRFSYRQTGAAILAHAGQNDEKFRSRLAGAFAGTDSNVRLGVEPK